MRKRHWIAVFFWSLLCCVFFCAGNVEAGFVRLENIGTNVISIQWQNAVSATGGYLDDLDGRLINENEWQGCMMKILPGKEFESYMPDNMQYSIYLNDGAVGSPYITSSGAVNWEIKVQEAGKIWIIPVAPSLEYLELLLHPLTWDKTEIFWAGCGLGLTFAGAALVVRLIRQVGRTNPQI